MKNKKYITISTMIARVKAHPRLVEIEEGYIIQKIMEFYRIVGMPVMYKRTITDLEINNYRASLPCDCVEPKAIKYLDERMRESTDVFYMDTCSNNPRKKHTVDNTFVVDEGQIISSFREGVVTLVYMAHPVDENGIPMIIDDEIFLIALYEYIKKEYFIVLYDLEQLRRDILETSKQEYSWAVQRCMGTLVKVSPELLEATMNMITTILPRTREFESGNINSGHPQRTKTF